MWVLRRKKSTGSRQLAKTYENESVIMSTPLLQCPKSDLEHKQTSDFEATHGTMCLIKKLRMFKPKIIQIRARKRPMPQIPNSSSSWRSRCICTHVSGPEPQQASQAYPVS